MTIPFIYPSATHVRRHGPAGYADHAGYRPWLRDEFSFRCVYCLLREQWGQMRGGHAIDHFLPGRLTSRPFRALICQRNCYTTSMCQGTRTITRLGDTNCSEVN